MDQKFEGTPSATIQLKGQKLTRSEVRNDWASKLQWLIKRDGKVIASVAARASTSYEHKDQKPGKYEVVLQMFKYVDYRKNKQGKYLRSKFIDISNKLTYTV